MAAPEDAEMVIESTASFERHLDDAIGQAREVTRALHDAAREAYRFEGQLAEERRAAEEMDRCWELDMADTVQGGASSEDEDGDGEDGKGGEWVPEAILGRRCKADGKRIFYKVKWKGHHVVTWEPFERVEAWSMIEEFDQRWMKRAFTASKKLRPVFYESRRLRAASPKAAAGPNSNLDRRREGRWTCEVEPFIWIPYDDAANTVIEAAFTAGASTVRVNVQGVHYTIVFSSMSQERSQSESERRDAGHVKHPSRKVQRTVPLRPEEERRLTEAMSVEELRAYIAGLAELTPLHYELLTRLHDMDKVVVATPAASLAQLHQTSFGAVLSDIAEGAEFPGFTMECYICLEDYAPESKLVVLSCGHFFHGHCAESYLQKYSNVCPVCKVRV